MTMDEGISEGFGLSRRSRPPSDLESDLGNITINQEDVPDGVKANLGYFVEAKIGSSIQLGVIAGITGDGGYVINPTIHRSCFTDSGEDNPQPGRGVWLAFPRIVYGALTSIERASFEILDTNGAYFKDVAHMGKYFKLSEYQENSDKVSDGQSNQASD